MKKFKDMSNLHTELEAKLRLDGTVSARSRIARREQAAKARGIHDF